ncbi:acylphosphatase [Hymenobacter sp. BT491]|uniref:acylphosphatase n=1 Tax=Hymenobacter sp. BT491 TaxID=2766779 RepID=UPI001653E8C7|nr:acylphosphatase [Hymenobacter sp. BT491]MBC6988224.1 acylphosphatase [Hymenobacter sp. BT491]
MVEHRTFRIHGRVQGVFFRQSTQKKAQKLGLTGYVRNEPDDTVWIEAEGPTEALDALAQWCRKGPPAARVDRVDVQLGAVQHYADFKVQR